MGAPDFDRHSLTKGKGKQNVERGGDAPDVENADGPGNEPEPPPPPPPPPSGGGTVEGPK